MKKYEPKEVSMGKRVGMMDIETTNLNGNIGYILCACIKDYKGKTHTFRIDDRRNPDKTSDKWVVEKLIEKMDELDVMVTWYGTRFDRPFVNTRAMKHRLAPPKKLYHRDLWYTSRAKLKMTRNSLATVTKFATGRTQKTHLDWDVWNRAQQGSKKDIGYIVDHCVKDVADTERVYKKMWPYLSDKLRLT